MNFKENRPLAFIVLAAAVLLSLLVQGPIAMLNARGDTEVLFMEGEMHELMTRCAAQGDLLGQMSAMYLNEAALAEDSAKTAALLGTEEYLCLPETLTQLSAELKAAPDPNACLAVLTELHAAVEKTYTALDMMQISGDDFRNIKLAYYDFAGAMDIVARDGSDPKSYTAQAQRFNKSISGFPAKLYCAVLNVDPLTVYGG